MSVYIDSMSLSSRQLKNRVRTRKISKRPGLDINIPPPLDNPENLVGKDFFKYVNGAWLQSVHVPPFISSFGISEEIELIIESKIEAIVRECIQISKDPDAILKDSTQIKQFKHAIGTVAQSALRTPMQINSIKTLHKLLNGLQCIRDATDIARTIGEFARYKVKGLLWVYGQYENECRSQYKYTLGVGKVGLPDISYYKKTAPGKSRTLFQYATMLKTLGQKFDIPELSSIVGLESILASSIQKSFSEEKKKFKGRELEATFSYFPFESFFQALGLEKWESEVFFIESENWFQTIQKMIRYLPLETWKLLFSHQLITHFLPYLPPPYDDIHFMFFRKILRGQTEKLPQKNLTISVIEDYMTPFISRLYVKEIVEKNLKDNATKFVKELQHAAENRLLEVDWMEKKTRELAKEKVKKMLTSVAYPDSFDKLKIPEVNNENLLENLLKLGGWRTDYEISRLGEIRSQQKDWDDPVFEVNAYYFQEANEMVVPSGSLYWPFFKQGATLGWNYGGLGCIVGHEITHAFDKEGKDFDPNGFEKKWWTRDDLRAYNKKTKALVELFNEQKVLGHPVSGTLTLSENISDLGGMAISLDALHHKLKELKNLSEEEKKEAYRQFFISYAVSWRIKEKPAKVLQGLFLDRHAPTPLRVNLVVSQFQEWYDAFGITEKDLMYIPPEKRIRIF